MAKERLQKLLAQANIASRRASEDLIAAGRVRVNGAVATLGDKADPDTDVIEVDGTRLKLDAQPHIYILLNKPKHVLTTDKPHRTDKRQTVMDLIGRKEHLFSVGRLDADSEGMVVMTNDGDLAQRLSHPRYRHTKTYRVEVLGLPTGESLEKWQQGIFLEDGKTAPCFVEVVKGIVKGVTTLRVVMTEGKKRQIRRVAAALGHPVRRLTRTHIGRLALGDLAPGQWRELTPKEVLALKTPSPEVNMLRAQPSRKPAEAAPEAQPPSAQDRSRPPRRKPAETSGDAPKPRRVSRSKPAEQTPDDAPKPRRAPERKPRSRKPEDHDDKWGKPAPEHGRKPSRPAKSGPNRAPKRDPRGKKDRPR